MSHRPTAMLLSPNRHNIARSLSKRPRSPDPEKASVKRARALPPSPAKDREEDKERRKAEKEAQKEEFRVKYTRHFPSWTFHFDVDHCGKESFINDLSAKIKYLGGSVDDFFSNAVTHLITNQPIPVEKENNPKTRAQRVGNTVTRSPSRRPREEPEQDTLAHKALAFGIKIWNTDKLSSVLARCLIPISTPTPAPANNTSLNRLLRTERMQGTTSERDPSAKRHDFRYFSRGSYFVLVEDMRSELATIAAQEYVKTRGSDGYKPQFPVLHCHPHARGPFVPFDEKEKRRYERTLRIEKEKEKEQERQRQREELRRVAQAQKQTKKPMDLRRSVSMSNLHQHANSMIDLDETFCLDSANASGYLASGTGGYVAASGNSVGITSTTGTTSTGNGSFRNQQLPASVRAQTQREVVTSRKATLRGAATPGTMGPPEDIPDRPHVLRKSRSTNTLRLPKRDEGSKPGYCESCRTKFEDFKAHVKSKKHRKFADNTNNFVQLDQVLARVKRRTRDEVHQEHLTFMINKQREKERLALENQPISPFKPDDHDPDDVFRDD